MISIVSFSQRNDPNYTNSSSQFTVLNSQKSKNRPSSGSSSLPLIPTSYVRWKFSYSRSNTTCYASNILISQNTFLEKFSFIYQLKQILPSFPNIFLIICLSLLSLHFSCFKNSSLGFLTVQCLLHGKQWIEQTAYNCSDNKNHWHKKWYYFVSFRACVSLKLNQIESLMVTLPYSTRRMPLTGPVVAETAGSGTQEPMIMPMIAARAACLTQRRIPRTDTAQSARPP